jgi:long-subunit fatty acid transport protein
MKRLTLLMAILMPIQFAFAGGILTNTNQSAQFARMLSRNASTKLDAVYFNPAGMIKLENGLHFGIHNQSIFQTRSVSSAYPFLNNGEYEGKITAPVFPDVYAAWKKDKIAVSFMLGPVGGGGGAKYDNGIPSFEKQISGLVPGLAGLSAMGQNVTDYAVDISLEGTSIFWGLQGGVTYELNDAFSVYGGVRYSPATNSYNGAIENIALTVNGASQGAQSFLSNTSAAITSTVSQQLTPNIELLQGAIDAGLLNADDALSNPALVGALQAFGVNTTGFTNGNALGALNGIKSSMTTQAAELAGTAVLMGNKQVDVKQKGSGITPILGLNISPVENLNIGVKYEFQTTLTLTNETTIDELGMFPDGEKAASDIPAILSVGTDYKFSDAFNAQLSFTNYFDKNVNWHKNIYGEDRVIDNNSYELALGLQYSITDNFAISIGGLHTTTGVSEQYQSDFSFSNTSNTGAAGFEWKLNDALTFDFGVMYTVYDDENKTFTEPVNYTETYGKENICFAFGIGYSIF